VVSVTIEDVDDNPPKFDQDEYTVSILENSPQSQFVLQTRVTDLDLVQFLKTSLSLCKVICMRKELTK